MPTIYALMLCFGTTVISTTSIYILVFQFVIFQEFLIDILGIFHIKPLVCYIHV
jgi:hypothetical protein